jgi:hypothetical protein
MTLDVVWAIDEYLKTKEETTRLTAVIIISGC